MILTNLHLVLILCLFHAVLLLTNADSNNDTSDYLVPCEEGWYFFGDQCYKAGEHEDGVPWINASRQCQEWGGRLVSIHSQELNDFLTAVVLGNSQRSSWIGLVDKYDINLKNKQEPIKFSWEDGSLYDYQNWAPRNPSSSLVNGYEGCVEIMFIITLSLHGKWNDVPCESEKSYICEKPSNKTLKTPDKLFCSDDEGRGYKFQGTCFQINTKPTTWDEAQRYCENVNGNLVTINDYYVDIFLKYILSDSDNQYWIGMKYTAKTGKVLEWNSKWHVSYHHIVRTPKDEPEGPCLLMISHSQWISTSCSKEHAFICEISNATAPVLQNVEGVSCPKENPAWNDLGGEFCYYFNTNHKVSWYSALRECMKMGGTLAKISSKVQEEIFRKILQYRTWSVHLGLTSIPSNGREFVWTDLSSLNFTHWRPTEPNSQSEMCGELITNGMNWNDINCEAKNGYICEVKKSNPKNELQVTEIGQRDILDIYPKRMLNLIDAALLILSQNSAEGDWDI